MKTASSAPDRFTVEMSAREAFICRAALREVLYGFNFPDFEPRMGCTRQEATALLESLPLATLPTGEREIRKTTEAEEACPSE